MKTFKQLTEVSAFDFVKSKIEKEVGKGGYVSKDNPRNHKVLQKKQRFVLIKQKLMQKMLQNVKKTHHRVVILKVSNNDTS